jgi:hypothetical protein
MPPKLQLTFSGLQGIISQKTKLFIYNFVGYFVYCMPRTVNFSYVWSYIRKPVKNSRRHCD